LAPVDETIDGPKYQIRGVNAGVKMHQRDEAKLHHGVF
jgi:hypothetical protein